MSVLSEWQTKTLGAVIKDIGDGGTPNTNKKECFGGTIPWVVIKDIRKEISSSKTTLTPLGLDSCSAKLWPADSVILSTGATIGEVGLAKVPVSTKQGIHGIVCGNQLSSSFLYYKLQTLRDFLNANAQGSTIREVRATFLRTIPIFFPTALPEQTKIAEILSMVDRAIEQTEALIAKQQRIKTGLMQDLLTRGIDEHGNLRSEQTHEFKDSPLGRIPVEWEVKRLNELVDEGITYGIVQAGPNIENGVPYIRTGDMAGETINAVQLLKTSERIAKSYKRSAVFSGDIVFALRATVGKVLPVSKELEGSNLTQGTAKISPKKSIESTFLLWALQTVVVQDQIRLHQKGTTFMEITLADLRSIEVALPIMQDEQSSISEKLTKHDDLRLQYIKNRQKLRALKTALMQDLLTGEVRVTPLLSELQEAEA